MASAWRSVAVRWEPINSYTLLYLLPFYYNRQKNESCVGYRRFGNFKYISYSHSLPFPRTNSHSHSQIMIHSFPFPRDSHGQNGNPDFPFTLHTCTLIPVGYLPCRYRTRSDVIFRILLPATSARIATCRTRSRRPRSSSSSHPSPSSGSCTDSSDWRSGARRCWHAPGRTRRLAVVPAPWVVPGLKGSCKPAARSNSVLNSYRHALDWPSLKCSVRPTGFLMILILVTFYYSILNMFYIVRFVRLSLSIKGYLTWLDLTFQSFATGLWSSLSFPTIQRMICLPFHCLR